MPFSFPSSPTVGQQSTQNGRAYQWNGAAWQLVTTLPQHSHTASEIDWVAIQPWAANTAYAKGDLVSNAGIAYRRSAAGTSGATFNVANWQQITPSEFVGSQITSGTVPIARLGTGSPSASNFLRGDGAFAVPSVSAATTTTLGGVIVPTSGGLTVDGSGNISAGFATAAQAAACTSATTVLSPARFQDAQLAWVQIDTNQYGGGTLANGGSTGITSLERWIGTGTTANGSSLWRAINNVTPGFNVGTSSTYTVNQTVDWSKPRAFQIRLTSDGAYTTNSVMRVQWGKDQATTTIGQMAAQGIGFEIRNKRVWLTAHNGTSLTAVDSGQDMSTNYYSTYDFLVTSDGAGNVALYINGTQYATTASGPTTASSSVVSGFTVEVTNGGDTTNCVYRWLNYVKFLNGR